MDRLAVVTGTSSGIGRAVADALLARGWEVVGVARRDAPIRQAAYHHARLDLGDEGALSAGLDAALGEHLGRPRARIGLVSNAAVLDPVGAVATLDPAALARAFAVNVIAPARLLALALAGRGTARLTAVNVSSGAATRPYAGWGAYCSTKAALRMVGLVAAAEAEASGTRGVSVVSYEPGVVDTDMQASVRALEPGAFPMVKRFRDLHAEGRLVPPAAPAAEIAGLLDRDDLPPFAEMRHGA
ncbi:MAG TPA: SDR family NAD(P)-dependent oxidoreductase [Anaeromyxobacteraceae bacterium]|nr:SDR family NAD(P)-dependent oxidoreductase [Anaeromyxobacteraceae bacterium]